MTLAGCRPGRDLRRRGADPHRIVQVPPARIAVCVLRPPVEPVCGVGRRRGHATNARYGGLDANRLRLRNGYEKEVVHPGRDGCRIFEDEQVPAARDHLQLGVRDEPGKDAAVHEGNDRVVVTSQH